MARAVWTGAVSFGLVNVPVKAYTAVHDHEVHFHQLERKSGARIRYQKVSDKTGKPVDADDIELGYETTKGHYVVIDPDELDRLRPRTTRTIDVHDFVDLDDIDPIYYQRTYWIAPDGESAAKAYRLLLQAMEDEGKVGIGEVVMRNKQYLAAVRPLDGALAMSTMRFADEVVPQSDIDALPGRRKADAPAPKEVKLAKQIIDSLATEWDPNRYHDTFTEELKDVLHRKAEGKEIVVEEAPAADAEVIDLMAALEASVNAAKKARKGSVTKEIEKAAKRIAAEAEADDDEDADADADDSGSTRGRSRTRAAAKTAQKPAKRTMTKKRASRSTARKSA